MDATCIALMKTLLDDVLDLGDESGKEETKAFIEEKVYLWTGAVDASFLGASTIAFRLDAEQARC